MRALKWILTLKDKAVAEPTLEAILQAVAQEMRVPMKEMLAHRRFNAYCRARFVYYYAAYRLTSQKEEAIAAMVNRERSAASYGKTQVERDINRYEPFVSRIVSQFSTRREAA